MWKSIGVLAAMIILIYVFMVVKSSIVYNNGICPQCGGNYVYQQAVGHRYITSYIYQCDKCGKIIEIDVNK